MESEGGLYIHKGDKERRSVYYQFVTHTNSFKDTLELTQFPRIVIFHGQYNEPRQQRFVSYSEAQYFWVDDGSVRDRIHLSLKQPTVVS